jgi:hypothetical protein
LHQQPYRGAAKHRRGRRAQEPVAAHEDGERTTREALAAAERPRHEFDRVRAGFLERLGRAHPVLEVSVHGPLAHQVADHRGAPEARLVLRHELVVRHHIGHEVRRIAQGEGAVMIVVRGRRDPAQCGPEVAAAERCAAEEEAPDDREIGQASAGEHQARQPPCGGAQLGVDERDGSEGVLRQKDVGLQPPRMRVGHIEQY